MNEAFAPPTIWMTVGLIMLGASMLLWAIAHLAVSARAADRGDERGRIFHEGMRASLVQAAIVFIGIGASLASYFYQQAYQREIDDGLRRTALLNHVAYRFVQAYQQYDQNVAPLSEIMDKGGVFITVTEAALERKGFGNEVAQALLTDGRSRVDILSELFTLDLDPDYGRLNSSFTVYPDLREDAASVRFLSPRLVRSISRDDETAALRFSKFRLSYDDLEERFRAGDWSKKAAALACPDLARSDKTVTATPPRGRRSGCRRGSSRTSDRRKADSLRATERCRRKRSSR